MSSELEQNWNNGACRRFQIPSADHTDEAHSDAVYSIHLRDSCLVSASRDKTVRIWNVDTQRLVRPPLRSHEASVICVQFDDSPEQDVIVSGGADRSVIVWRFSTGEILKNIEKAHYESVLSLCFDDKYLVTGGKDKRIKIWNRSAMQKDGQSFTPYSELYTIHGHAAAVNVVKLHENTIVSGGGDRAIHLWNIESGDKIRTVTGHLTGVACLQYNGRLIISGSTDRSLRIFDLEKSEDEAQVALLEGHSEVVRAVQVRTSGSGAELERIVSGGYDEVVKIWHHDSALKAWTCSSTLATQADVVGERSMVFQVQMDERRLVCSTSSTIIKGWDFASSDGNADL